MSSEIGLHKLFEVNLLDGIIRSSYLTTGSSEDTEQTIKERESIKLDERYSRIVWYVQEVNEVDGHKIIVI